MKKYIFSTCVFFITTSILASHMYHTEGVVKNALGKHSSKVPVYNSSNSNNPTGSTYIRAGKISGYHIGTFSHTTRKKTRKGTFTIKTITKSVIEDNAQHPLAQTSIAGATKSITSANSKPKKYSFI